MWSEDVRKQILLEDSRNTLLNKSKSDSIKSKQRYNRRTKSKVANTVKQYNDIDMNKLFKLDILTININVVGETDNYIVKISFGGFLDELHEQLKGDRKLDLGCILRALISAFNKDDVYIHCSCLHPNTKIKLLDGRALTVQEMQKEFEAGKKLYVYSVDRNGDFKPGEVEKVWVTGEAFEFIKITLDNDEEILTTPDHLYMLRDGSYKPACELSVGQSLMPLYFNETKNGYETVKFNSTGKYHSTYKIVAESLKSDEIEEAKSRVKDDDNMPYDIAIHHIDYNKSNNVPENLQPMTAREHWEHHAHTVNRLWEDEEFRASQSQKGREWMNYLNANPTERMIEGRKKFTEAGRLRNYDEDRKQQQSEIAKKYLNAYWNSLSEEEYALMRNKGKDDEWRKAISESHKKYWQNLSEEEYQKRVEKITEVNNREDIKAKSADRMRETQRRLNSDPSYKRKQSERIKKSWEENREKYMTEKFINARKNAFNNLDDPEWKQSIKIGKIHKVIEKIIEAGEVPSPETYEKFRTNGYCKYTCVFSDWQELSEYFKLNHSIKNIERITLENTPVYDIKVKEYENFLTDAGVILHNCPDAKFRFDYWQTRTKINSGDPQNIPSDITNPNNKLGSGCKHALLVLSNTSWLIKVASVINNYTKYMELHYPKMYADIIYPAIYEKEYEEPVQLIFGDEEDELVGDKETIDVANEIGRKRGQFKQGNTQGVRFASKPRAIQQSFEDEEEI